MSKKVTIREEKNQIITVTEENGRKTTVIEEKVKDEGLVDSLINEGTSWIKAAGNVVFGPNKK